MSISKPGPCLWAGIFATDNLVFCQMELEEIDLYAAGWPIRKLRQDKNEPSLAFQARADAVMSAEAEKRSLNPIRLHSEDGYRRLGVPQMMREIPGD